jgi:hypothetical protein
MRLVLVALLAACASGPRPALHPAGDAVPTGLTIVLQAGAKAGAVEEVRWIDVPADGEVSWGQLPAGVDPRTLMLQLDDQAATVDDVKVTPRSVDREESDKPAKILTREGEIDGRILGADARGVALATGEGVLVIGSRAIHAAEIDELPKDGLFFHVRGATGRRLARLDYVAPGLSYAPLYQLVVDRDRVDLEGTAIVANTQGLRFSDARVVLDLGKGRAPIIAPHITIQPASQTAIELFRPIVGAPARHLSVYDPIGEKGLWTGTDVNRDKNFGFNDVSVVDEYVELERPLSAPLPAGRWQIARRGANGIAVAQGELDQPAVAAGEHLRLRLGPAPELVASRRQNDFALEDARIVEEIEVDVTNRAEAPAEVVLLERLARSETWLVSWTSDPATKEGPRTIRFRVRVPPGETKRVSYRVIWDLN